MSTLMLIPILFACFFNLITAAPDAKVAIRGRYPVDEAIEQRAACNADNVLRALRANSVAATHFCSDYIHIPVVTVFKSVPSITATTQVTIFPMAIRKLTQTVTSTVFETPNSAYFPSSLPDYVAQYPTSRISSGCSCLSVPTSTDTVTASYSTVYRAVTTTTTSTLTGPCATGTLYAGAYNISSPAADATRFTLDVDAYTCCSICNSPGQGPFSSCIAWAFVTQQTADHGALEGVCTSILAGPPFSNYKLPNCYHSGLEPGAIKADKAKFPGQVGGGGNCASGITVTG
ncbi:hypothetical protein MMC22_000124 [Lobaria immixta]|nr:hypothetical protein [Lobaria immixta]